MICRITDILNASQCVHNWLGYLSKVSDNCKLIAESSLKYPFVECLERHSIKDVHLEFSHPLFKDRRIDAYIGSINSDGAIDKDSPQMTFIEFKFVRGDTLSEKEQHRYFNDILRLSYLKQEFPQSECYLLVCGETVSFNDAFRYEPIKKCLEDEIGKRRKKKKSIYNDWLSFELKSGEKNIELVKHKYRLFVLSFREHYLSNTREGISFEGKEKQILNTQLQLILPPNESIDNSYSLGL